MAGYPEVISIGNLLVEVMRTDLDQPLDRPGTFAGPFPSGDTPIYIDAVARMGHPAGFIGAIGGTMEGEPDDFGCCLLNRFERDGVDASQVVILPGQSTGVAFVAYFSGGHRKFLYHWRYAAAGQLGPQHVNAAYFQNCRWLHLTGCNLSVSLSSRLACLRAMEVLPTGAKVSFDANLRPELLSVEQIRELCQPAIARADVLLPSLGEAAMLTGAASDAEGCRLWVAQGKLVVLKMGRHGSRIYTADQTLEIPGFPVTEVDPTGAGDAFCGGLTVALLENQSLEHAGQFANAAGALAVTQFGPMEGNPDRTAVNQLLGSAMSGRPG